jgi:Ca-activated chloride channel family protein
VPVGAASPAAAAVPLVYQQRSAAKGAAGELMQVKVRYKDPAADTSQLVTETVSAAGGDGSEDLRFASAVAELALLLRRSEHRGEASFAQVVSRARDTVGADPGGYRREFLALAEKAQALAGPQLTSR